MQQSMKVVNTLQKQATYKEERIKETDRHPQKRAFVATHILRGC
jgi:hypothetical protein